MSSQLYYSIFLLGFILLLCKKCRAGPDEDKLLKYLFEGSYYNPVSRPVANDSKPIEVKFKIEIQQVVDVDETKEILESILWLHFEWMDERLKWDPDEYGGVDALNLPISNLWKPDVILYNTVHEDIDTRFETNAYVYHTGFVMWIPLGLFQSSCPINIEWFPFDTQMCKLKFGSWTYGGKYLNLTRISDKIDTSNYQTNGEWDLVVNDAVLTEMPYEGQVFQDITGIVGLRRRPGFYLLNVLIPCTFVSLLTLFNFLQAPDSGEKVGLGITIMLSLSVFQLIIADMIPRTSTSIPVIGAYFCGVMCLCTISLIMTLMTLKCHYTKPEMHKMPDMMRIVICDWLSWFLRMQRPGKRLTKQYLKQQWSSRRSQSRASPFSVQQKSSIGPTDRPKSSVALVAELSSSGSVVFHHKVEPNGINHQDEIDERPPCEMNPPPESAAFHAMAAQDLESLRYELRTILNEIKHVTKKIKDDEDASNETNEWQYAALVVDRLCFWISSLLFLIGTVGVFVYAPQQ